MAWPVFVAFVFGAYLMGAIPFGLLIGRARGVDVRQHGSRNIGATNVGRVLGRKWGFLCLGLDILKGFVPAFAASFLIERAGLTPGMLFQWLAIALAAVLGHMFPVYLRFRGGKGVATTIGVALGIWPFYTVPMAVALLLYAGVRFGTGFVSAGSLALATMFPLAFAGYVYLSGSVSMRTVWPLQVTAVLLGLLIILRHRSNIARLFRGEEHRVEADAEPAGNP